MRKFRLRSTRGFSLIELMIAAGIATALTMGITAVIVNMQRENRAMSDKVEAVDVERQLGVMLADNLLCSCQLGPKSKLIADPVVAGRPATYHVELDRIMRSCADPDAIFAARGSRMSASSASSLLVKRTAIVGLRVVGRDSKGQPNLLAGEITIEFDPLGSTTQRALRGVKTMRTFTASNNVLLACVGQAPTTIGSVGTTVYRQSNPDTVSNASITNTATAYCDLGYRTTGGGFVTDGSQPCVPTSTVESTITQHPTLGAWGWRVTMKCARFHAVVACQREEN